MAPSGFFTEPVLVLGRRRAPRAGPVDGLHDARRLAAPDRRDGQGHPRLEPRRRPLGPGPDAPAAELAGVSGPGQRHGPLAPRRRPATSGSWRSPATASSATSARSSCSATPARPAQGTGDIDGQLPATAADGTVGPGHSNVVTVARLHARRPVPRLGQQRQDRPDLGRRRPAARSPSWPRRPRPVNALAIFANGTRLVAGGERRRPPALRHHQPRPARPSSPRPPPIRRQARRPARGADPRPWPPAPTAAGSSSGPRGAA